MTIALYATIWIALAFFAAGEAEKRRLGGGQPEASWAWWAYSSGVVLCAVHVVIAFAVRHNWSHDAALEATARQTAAVYSLDWGGGLYVNYLFLGVWASEAWRWRSSPARYFGRARVVTWAVRVFFFVVILNATVIFAGGIRRVAGALILAWLLWSWRRPRL